jgi:hypothetical protein
MQHPIYTTTTGCWFQQWTQRLVGILKNPKTVIATAILFGLANTTSSSWTAALDLDFLVFDNMQPEQPLLIVPAQELRIGSNSTIVSSYLAQVEPSVSPTPSSHVNLSIYFATADSADETHPPRVAYITFTHLNGIQRFEDMILRAIDTWLPSQEQYYVVVSNLWKQHLQDLLEGNFSSYKNRIHPIYVACPESKFGFSPCCKQEQGLLYVWQNFATQYDWFVYMDDDIYMRANFLEGFVSTLPAHTAPIVLTSGAPPHRLGQAGYRGSKRAYKCSKDDDFKYPWASLAVYNWCALRRISNGLRLGGLTKQCLEFRVTHDTGNAILHWMYSIPTISIAVPQRPDRKRNHFMALHGVGRCERKKCTMNILHNWYTKTYRQPPNRSEYRYLWHNVSGFKTVQHYREYGDPESWKTLWHTMPTSACAGSNWSANRTLNNVGS